MTDHLPECYQYEHSTQHMDSYWCDSDCEADCICSALRACEKRVADDIWGAIREGSQYKSGFEGGLDAAREAVERASSLLQPLGPALAAIDALKEDK